MLATHAGHYCDRVKVTAAGCLLWATMTFLFGSARSLQQGIIVWAVNGLGLAMVRQATSKLTIHIILTRLGLWHSALKQSSRSRAIRHGQATITFITVRTVTIAYTGKFIELFHV